MSGEAAPMSGEDWLIDRFRLLALPPDVDPAAAAADPQGWRERLAQAFDPGSQLLALWCRLRLGEPEAGVELARWLEREPAHALGHWLLGDWLGRHGQTEAALQSLLTAWQLAPEDEAYFGSLISQLILAIRLTADGLGQPAEQLIEAALEPLLPQAGRHARLLRTLWTSCLEAGYEPGPRLVRETARRCLHSQRPELGRELLSELIARQPGRIYLQLSRACLLPMVYSDEAEILSWRDRCLTELETAMVNLQALGPAGLRRLGQDLPGLYLPSFLLAYQDLDNRPIYDLLGDFWQAALNALSPLPAPKPVASEALHIGIVSAHFYEHAVSQTFLGLIETLHILGAEVTLFDLSLNAEQRGSLAPDSVRARLHRISRRHERLPEAHDAAARRILELGPEVLIYPEIGMDLHSYLLAARRLAPLQLALSGHPESTGLPTIDAFVSSRGREIETAQAHYREPLLRLAHFPGVFRAPATPPPCSRGELGLPPELDACRFYVCPMTPFKIHPANDALFAGILAADPQGRLLLFEFGEPELCNALGARLQASLGPLYERVLFLPFLKPEAFHQLLRVSELCLDSRGFGGGNTPRQVLGLGVPMLTWPGERMKQRVTAELCALLEVPELIVDSAAAFVTQAVAIATNQALREDLRSRLLANRDRVFGREDGARELLAWCETRLR